MKKLIFLALIISFLCIYKSKALTEDVIIPNSAIRFRVVASSNKEYDQKIKQEVTSSLKSKLKSMLKDSNDINDTRKIINNHIDELSLVVKNTINSDNYEINYGTNYFPEKEYKGVKYPEGDYESLVIKLGSGLGKNFWCVLFPPLCLLDNDNNTNVEYKLFVKELINKYF